MVDTDRANPGISPRNRAAPSGAVLFYGLAALLIFAPLFQGGNRPLPLLVMELTALALLVGLAWRPWPDWRSPPRSLWVVLALLGLLPLAQLLPVPLAIWASLPGREFYAEALRQAGAAHEWRALSLIPTATEASWLALLPPLAVLVVALGLDSRRLLTLLLVFLGVAVAQALLGLIQYGDGPDSPFRFGNTLMGASASGTYINRNHLAGLLGMALPVALALLAATVGHGVRRHVSRRRGLRQWLVRFSITRLNQATLYGLAALAIVLGLIFTRSRSGVGLAILGILLCTLLFANRLGGRNIYGLMGTFSAIALGLASAIGLAPVWARFTDQDPLGDARWAIFDATTRAIGEFFPLGSGAGTYEEVMRRFHPPDFVGVTINSAHNDYLEWLLEGGLLAGLLIAIWLWLYARQWGRVWKRGEWTTFRFAQAGAGIALLLLMLHSLVDFNLRIPANALYAALLAAVFLHRSAVAEQPQGGRVRKTLDDDDGGGGGERPVAPPPARTIPPENQINPFAS